MMGVEISTMLSQRALQHSIKTGRNWSKPDAARHIKRTYSRAKIILRFMKDKCSKMLRGEGRFTFCDLMYSFMTDTNGRTKGAPGSLATNFLSTDCVYSYRQWFQHVFQNESYWVTSNLSDFYDSSTWVAISNLLTLRFS